MPVLTYTNNSSDRIDTPAGATVDTLSTFTYLIWFFNTGVGNQRFFTKGTTNQKLWRNETNGTDHVFVCSRTSGTTSDNFRTNDGLIVTNAWAFLGVTRDPNAGTILHGYRGSLTSQVIENTSYQSNVNGSLVDDTDAGGGFKIGNLFANNGAFSGNIAWVGVWNRVLTLPEMQALQYNPQVTSGNVLFIYPGYNGLGTQIDFSGNANHGTVTGTTMANTEIPISIPPWHLSTLGVGV